MKTKRLNLLKCISAIILTSTLFLSMLSCKKNQSVPHELLLTDWDLQAENNIYLPGKIPAQLNIDPDKWIQVKAPSTIMGALVNAKVIKDVFKDNNLDRVDKEQFNQPWWYHTQFVLEENMNHKLVFEGINYKANIWLNGKLLADSTEIEGAFGMWEFDISPYQKKENRLLVQVFPPAKDDLTIGFVDWNPTPPDNNMGIWRPVKVIATNDISLSEPFVVSSLNSDNLSNAALTISTEVENLSNQRKTIHLKGKIGDIQFEKKVQLKPNQSQNILFKPEDYQQLKLNNAKLWWPNLMGEPHLYELEMDCYANGNLSDKKKTKFGIRKIETYWTKDNHKGYKINGEKVLIKGAGWVDDIFLSDTPEKVTAQLEYAKHMNLNCIRLEGFWGNDKTIYEKADQLGLLIMIGWSCHWEWEGYCHRKEDDFMCIRTPHDMELQARAYQDQVKWLRNHPSIFTWVYGSDKLPLPELESLLNKYIHEVDTTRPILASCKYKDFDLVQDKQGNIIKGYINNSEISGPTGVKMLGPYAYTAPSYWYKDARAGGAYGFNTETGPGPQVPPIESLKKMLSDENLWPVNKVWDYHSGRNEFSTIDRYMEAFNARYGQAKSADDFAFRSQISNYEAIRPMFEAFEVNKHKATGVIQWMLNSAWPELFWQLYDWYLMPNGAFYGTKKACQPINAVYHYGDKNIYLTNSILKGYKNIKVVATAYNSKSELLFSKEITTSSPANSANKVLDLPNLKNTTNLYFINLQVFHKDEKIADNFYWLSSKPDVHDWKKSEWFFTPYKSYADFTELNSLPTTNVEYAYNSSFNTQGDAMVSCTLKNKSDKIAFFIELKITNAENEQTILPVFWSDNYVSLMANEEKTFTARIPEKYVKNKNLNVSIKGMNINPIKNKTDE